MTSPARAAVALVLAMAASPSFAQQRTAPVDVPAGPLGEAVHVLSKQSGASIGFRAPALARQRVNAVRGRLTPARALDRLLRGTPLHARQVAPGAFLIEPGPRRAAKPAPARPRRSPPPSIAAAPPTEIIVTGSKRDIALDAYPGGIEIVDGSRLSLADSARGTAAIETRLASVVSTHLGPGRNKLFIRGIADSSFVGPTQATVGQYWGNSHVTYSAPDPNLKLYDVGQIEVLEGPQGTLYGAGSLGGVMRVVPNAPNAREAEGALWGGAQAVQHGQPGFDGGALVNLPLIDDRLALRAVAFGSLEGGYIDDVERDRKDINKVRTFGGRAALRYRPDSDWSIDLSGVGQLIKGDDSQYAERDRPGLSRGSSIAQPYRNNFWLADLVVSRPLGAVDFTASLGYASQYVYERFEGPMLADVQDSSLKPAADAASAEFTQTNHIDMLMAEARLARKGRDGAGWLLGLSLLRNDAQVKRQTQDQALTGVHNQIEEATAYGETGMKLMDGLVLTGGGRLTHTRLSGEPEDASSRQLAFSLDPMAGNSRTETRLMPSLALIYRPGGAVSLFARYQQGFRPGGIAVRREYVQHYKGDRVGTAEIGGRYHHRDFEISANVSWTSWKDIQADLIDGFGFPTTSNIGDGRVFSMGVSGLWRPLDGLELSGALYINDSQVTTYSPIAIQLTQAAKQEGFTQTEDYNRLPNIANITGRLGFVYARPLSRHSRIEINGHARYIGKSTLGIGPVLGQLQGDYLDTGLELRLGTASRGWTLGITNLLDARGNRFALGSPFLVRDHNQITPLQPRSIRIGFEQRF